MSPRDAIVIGAGPAGLACAKCLRDAGIGTLILERAGDVGSAWRAHYDRLHLHTDRAHSGLPGLPMPAAFPRYPSRDQVVQYLENYARRFSLAPSFRKDVGKVTRANGGWRVACADETFDCGCVVVATGIAHAPYSPSWPGQQLFEGRIIHSAAYRNTAPFAGRKVLVVGFGNSGGEIALDLAEAGVAVTLAVRGPIQVIPRDLLGLPILTWALLYRKLPARLVDAINAPIIKMAVGSVTGTGLTLSSKGPRRTVEEDGHVPIFDIGTLDRIRDGSIRVRGAIERFEEGDVVFEDGRREPYDAVVLATGFRPDLRPLLPGSGAVLDDHGLPLATGRATAQPGLYFCGQTTSPTGQLREIGIEAGRIARLAQVQ